MPSHFSPQLIAALLLSSFIIAQYNGLRPVKNLFETIGLGACTALCIVAVAAVDWLLMHFVLQPLGLAFLNHLSAVLLIAVSAQVIAMGLQRRYRNYFPPHGGFQPLIIVNSLIVLLPLLGIIRELDFFDCLLRAVAWAAGSTILLVSFQLLREHIASAETPAPLRGAAIDMLSAGLIIAACSGLAGIF
jgi:H+/Na+-translocating ferredoxin:NAD+ oxidoreductase subunit A